MQEDDPRREWIRRLADQAMGLNAPPASLFLYITERCNLRCPFCSFSVNPPMALSEELSDAGWRELAGQAARWPGTMAYLVGGEIFVRKAMVLDIMSTLSRAGLVGNLTTNGLLLDPPDLRRIVEMGWNTIVFSLDGARPETHDGLRGRTGAHARVVETVRGLIEHRRRAGSTWPVVMLHMVVNRRNVLELAEMVRLARDLGVESLNAEFISPKTEACSDLLLSADEQSRLPERIHQAITLAESLGVRHVLGRLLQPGVEAGGSAATVQAEEQHQDLVCRNALLRAACFVPWTYITVHPDGTLGTCWKVRAADAPRAPATSLTEYWAAGADRPLRQRLLAGEPLPACRECCSHLGLETRLWRALALAALGDPEARAHLEAWARYDPNDPLVRAEQARLGPDAGPSPTVHGPDAGMAPGSAEPSGKSNTSIA